MKMNLEYLQGASFMSDLRIVLKTISRVFNPQEGKNDFIIRELLPVAKQKESLAVQEREEYLPAAEEAD
jgi:hypothetical protein